MLLPIGELQRDYVVRSAQFIDGENYFSQEYGKAVRIDPELNCGDAWDESRGDALFAIEQVLWEYGSCLVYARRLSEGGLYHPQGEVIFLKQWDNDLPFAPVEVLGKMNPVRSLIMFYPK